MNYQKKKVRLPILTLSVASLLIGLPSLSYGAIDRKKNQSLPPYSSKKVKKYKDLKKRSDVKYRFSPPIFDFPVTYNKQVKKWIRYFQTSGRRSFHRWMERSARYAPFIKKELEKHNMPLDLLYVAMVESGFSPYAHSPAGAVGLWQFVAPTARRYGLKVNWWIDERKNFTKATGAAIRYKKDLHRMFGSWHLVSASYNTGEGRIRRLIRKHKTNDFWKLAEKKVIANETINYVPKIIAATLIAKSPALYGFRNLKFNIPFKYETMAVPGGTNLNNLARYIGVKASYLKSLNPDLIKGFIPREIHQHQIKVPVGSKRLVQKYAQLITKHPKI